MASHHMSLFPLTRRIHNVISAGHSNEIIFLIDCFKSKNGICHPTVEHGGNFFSLCTTILVEVHN